MDSLWSTHSVEENSKHVLCSRLKGDNWKQNFHLLYFGHFDKFDIWWKSGIEIVMSSIQYSLEMFESTEDSELFFGAKIIKILSSS